MTIAVAGNIDAALSPQWLSAAPQPRFPGAYVSTLKCGPVIGRLSTNVGFTIDEHAIGRRLVAATTRTP
jgi:hypothetical protein